MMNDLISRQAAINSFRYDDDGTAWDVDDIVYRLEQFPSAQPMMTNAADLINRGDAILAVYKRIKQLGMENDADVLSIRQSTRDLASAQPELRWIPVTERLPKEYGEYICTMENEQVQECGFVPENQRGLVDGWSTCEADGHKFLGYADVLAWMPLPEPWKEGEEG